MHYWVLGMLLLNTNSTVCFFLKITRKSYEQLFLTLSRRRSLSYGNQSIDLLWKLMHLFPNDRGLMKELKIREWNLT